MRKLILLTAVFIALAVLVNIPAPQAEEQNTTVKAPKKGKGGGKAKTAAARPDMVHVKLNGMDFWMDKYEVTQEDFRKVMGNNPSHFTNCGGKCPVDQVNWHEATEYCKKVGKRLPTEQEWEIAAKGGREVKYATGSGELDCTNANWGRGPSYRRYCSGAEGPVAVGSYAPNALGIYDMTGNVGEWTATPGRYVVRGGDWGTYYSNDLTVSYSDHQNPDARLNYNGFRCAQ